MLSLWPDRPIGRTTTTYAVCTGYWTKFQLYDREGQVYQITDARPPQPISVVGRFLSRSVYNPRIEVTFEYGAPESYSLADLKDRVVAAIALDDDIITQFHDAETITGWVEQALTFADLVQAIRRSEQEPDDA